MKIISINAYPSNLVDIVGQHVSICETHIPTNEKESIKKQYLDEGYKEVANNEIISPSGISDLYLVDVDLCHISNMTGGKVVCIGRSYLDIVSLQDGVVELKGESTGNITVMHGGIFSLEDNSSIDIHAKTGGTLGLAHNTNVEILSQTGGSILAKDNAIVYVHGVEIGNINTGDNSKIINVLANRPKPKYPITLYDNGKILADGVLGCELSLSYDYNGWEILLLFVVENTPHMFVARDGRNDLYCFIISYADDKTTTQVIKYSVLDKEFFIGQFTDDQVFGEQILNIFLELESR